MQRICFEKDTILYKMQPVPSFQNGIELILITVQRILA